MSGLKHVSLCYSNSKYRPSEIFTKAALLCFNMSEGNLTGEERERAVRAFNRMSRYEKPKADAWRVKAKEELEKGDGKGHDVQR